MALAYSDITVELKEIFLNNRPQELYDISPKGTVPVLCISKSNIIDESLDIMKWAIEQKENDSWFISKKEDQLNIISTCDKEFKFWLDRYKYFDRYPENNQNYYFNKCDDFLSTIDKLLKNNTYLFSNTINLVDVAIFPFIRQFANVNQNIFQDKYNNINCWLNNFLSSHLFLSVMKKYPEYNYNQSSLIINFNN